MMNEEKPQEDSDANEPASSTSATALSATTTSSLSSLPARSGVGTIVGIYSFLIIVCSAIITYGYLDPNATGIGLAFVPAGTVGLIVCVALFPIAYFNNIQRDQQRRSISALEDRLSTTLNQIHEHTLLSDSAKRIAYRREERHMLRRAIEEDITLEDWEAASVLVREMSDQFGYVEEAEEFHRYIEKCRGDIMAKRLREALDRCDSLVQLSDWTAAYAESARIMRMFPDAPQVQDLDQRVRQSWLAHKQALEQDFLEVAGGSDVEGAMEILRELDGYLTEREAKPYREIARGIIGQARDNLGLQFKIAVRNQDWATSIEVGDRIIDEFPNTLMAREVRERIGMLRTRANEAVSQPPARVAIPSSVESPISPDIVVPRPNATNPAENA